MPEVARPSTSLFWKMRKQMSVGRRASVDMANIAPYDEPLVAPAR
jgi:hypothetical protein